MKKKVIQFLKKTGVMILIFVLIIGNVAFKTKQVINNMKPTATMELVSGVYSINNNFVNMFIIRDGEKYIAIDAGADQNIITGELQKLKINPDKVEAVLLTHTHHDHTAALNLFKNAVIYLSKEELDPQKGEKPGILTLGDKTFTNKFSYLNDQQMIQFEKISVRAIFTPGHTPGSTSYLVNDNYLFVGDAFGLNNGKVDKPNKEYTKDMNAAIKSFNKINHLPKVHYIFTAHTGFSGNYKEAVDTQLKPE
jgi:glyoxylase-like metal-dependent hydrolase (beta-lactamase superfamily II)